MRFMLESGVQVLPPPARRARQAARLPDPRGARRARATPTTSSSAPSFSPGGLSATSTRRGIFVIWASDRPSGFTDDDLDAAAAHPAAARHRLQDGDPGAHRPQHHRGLSRPADRREGAERARSGSATASRRARSSGISDLRSSTRLAETMPSADFLELLNVYFECAARPGHRRRRRGAGLRRRRGAGDLPGQRRRELPALTRRALVGAAASRWSSPTASTPSARAGGPASRSATASASTSAR